MDIKQIEKISKKITVTDQDKISKYEKKISTKKSFKRTKKLFPKLLTFYIDDGRHAAAIELVNRYIRYSGLKYKISDKKELRKFFNCKQNIFKLPIYSKTVQQWDNAIKEFREKNRKKRKKIVTVVAIILVCFIIISSYSNYQYKKFSSKLSDTKNLNVNIASLKNTFLFKGKSELLKQYYISYFKQLIQGPQYLDMYDYNLFKQSIKENEKLKQTIPTWELSKETKTKLLNTINKVNYGLNGRILKQDKKYKQASMYFMNALNEDNVVEDVFSNDFINSQIALLNAEINMPLEEIKKFLKTELTEESFNTYMAYGDLFKMLAPPNASSKEFINYYGEAENYYKKAISIEPDNIWAHIRLGHLCRDKFTLTGNESYYELAEKEYNKAKELALKAELLPLGPLISLGHLHKDRSYKYNDRKELNKAIGFYGETLKLDKDNIVAFYNLGCIYLKEKQLDWAIRYFRKILAINKKFVDTNYRLGYTYYLKFQQTGNKTYLENAKYYYEQQLEQDKEYGVTDFLERGGIQGYKEVIEQYRNMIHLLKEDAKYGNLMHRARQILIGAYLRRKKPEDYNNAYNEFLIIKDKLSSAEAQSLLLRIQNERSSSAT